MVISSVHAETAFLGTLKLIFCIVASQGFDWFGVTLKSELAIIAELQILSVKVAA